MEQEVAVERGRGLDVLSTGHILLICSIIRLAVSLYGKASKIGGDCPYWRSPFSFFPHLQEEFSLQLNELQIGQSAIVTKIDLPFTIERRLQALGMTLGTRISVLNRKGKGIMIILLRGTRFALGYNMTRNIGVDNVEVAHD